MVNLVESFQPKVNYQDLVVRLQKTLPMPSVEQTWNKISIVVLHNSDLEAFPSEGLEVNLATFDFSPYVHEVEIKELPKLDVVVKMFSLVDAFETSIESIVAYGSSLCVLSMASIMWLEKNYSLQNENVVVWLTLVNTHIPNEFVLFASRLFQGVMLDSSREGKLVFALVRLLGLANRIEHTHQIVNNSFSGLTLASEASFLEEKGISYWFATKQQVFPDGLFVGKNQAFRVYYDVLISFRLKESVASFVQGGRVVGNLLSLKNAMFFVASQFLQELNPDITDFSVPTLGQLTTAQRITGTVPIEATYQILGEVRRVEVNITTL